MRNWKPVCTLVGDAVSGAEFAPFWLWLAPASTLPPAFGRGWASPQPASSSLVLLSLLFCELAGSAFLSLSLSLVIPQFRLLSHVSSFRLPSGHSGPVFTLSNAARFSLLSPHLLVVDESIWGTFLLGVAFRHVICRFYLLFLPVMLPSGTQKLPPRPAAERVFWWLETIL